MTRRRKPKKPGGRRKGAGRPRLGADKRSEAVKVLLTPAEFAAVEAVVAAENAAIDDGKPATPATWFRDLGLDRLGLLPGGEDNNAVGQAPDAAGESPPLASGTAGRAGAGWDRPSAEDYRAARSKLSRRHD